MLVVETGKLSREKIRQQFAVDAAATLEMNQYTDLFNRLAYINGVFPQRIFRGGMGTAGNSGLYPASSRPLDENDKVWPIRFGAGREYANVPDPPQDFGILHMYTDSARGVAIEKANKVAFNYISVYRWLGDVATAQKLIFERAVAKDHALLRKSLWMNLRRENDNTKCSVGPTECGEEAAEAFSDINIRMHYVSGFKHCPVTMVIDGKSYTGALTGAFQFDGSGLFQLATVESDQMAAYDTGFVVKRHWTPESNYFNLDLKSLYDPYVRTRVASKGGKVWPDTTPKFFTRTYP